MPESRPPATYISDLRPNRVASIEASVVSVEPTREVAVGTGGSKKVRNVRLKDGTGEVVLVLWGNEVDLVQEEGQKVRISEGWVKDYKGHLQISLGRTGSLQSLVEPSGRRSRSPSSVRSTS
ncbi:MAG: hypothetical protein KGJ23_07625 [Euryarchaeota archaeon]|nr:hypothetical protein [Euryarchaeota archaeon]MDE1880635.1 hypothetical protein [Euryarchaeota archaeon]MDE2044216.1 hypothetical protein [Thermoplasmata archaeon]